tara:strand:+ start:342 stop:491 length:150 start_codon:yes stop_codon:yes gene_type:complete
MRITQYGHSIILLTISVMIISYSNSLWMSGLGGLLAGFALRTSRKSREE